MYYVDHALSSTRGANGNIAQHRHRRRTGFWSEYHFAATPGHPVGYPGIVQDSQHTFAVLRALPCDVFLGAHGGYFDMLTKLEHYPRDGPRVFIDPAGYKVFVADAQKTFEQASTKQQAAAAR